MSRMPGAKLAPAPSTTHVSEPVSSNTPTPPTAPGASASRSRPSRPAPSDVEYSGTSSSDESASDRSQSPEDVDSSDRHVSGRTPRSKNMDNTRDPGNVQVLDAPVFVQAPAEEHSSWSSWQEYLRDYSTRTHQVIRVSLSLSCKIRNARLSKSKAASEGERVPYVPVEWEVYQRTYICTHGWPTKDRGTGRRPKQFVRGTGCPFRFIVQVVEDHHGQWSLRVRHGVFKHNHAIGPTQFDTYSENRKVTDIETKATVDQMIHHERKRGRIYDFLLARGEKLVLSDVDNLVSKFKSDGRADLDDDEAVARALTEFAAVEGNAVTVDENEYGHSGVINMSSRHQLDMLARFPELLLVDCTHKTNRYNYQLCTFMAVDEYGKGQPVQHSLLERNGDWHMSRALDHLFRVDKTIGKRVQVLMVDKDLNEIRVLKTYFPRARVLICLFHVVKYLKLASRKPEYGKLSPDDHEAVDVLVHNMVYAGSEDIFNKNLTSMRRLCVDTGFMDFFYYFEENWVGCTDMWVMWERARLAHMRVHTNNHLESWFGKFKLGVTSTLSMLDTVQAIVAADARTHNEYLFSRSRVGSRVHRGYDEEMSQVLRFTTHFVASHVEKEYISAMSKVTVFKYDVQSIAGSVVVKGKHASHVVDLTTWCCTCSFGCAMRLPCQHAIAYRKWANTSGCVIPLSGIDERWLQPVRQPTTKRPIVVNEFVKGRFKRKTLDSAAKFKLAISATQPLCNELADISDDEEFQEHLDFVMNLWNNVRQRKRIKVVGQTVPTTSERQGLLLSNQISTVPDTPDVSSRGAEENQIDLYEEKLVSGALKSDDNEGNGMKNDNIDENTPPDITIKLNPKAAKTGRPRYNRKEREADDKRKRAVFNESEEHRRNMGDVTLVQLANSLHEELPGLQRTLDRVVIPVKFESQVNKRPKLVLQQAPVLNENAFYLLPHKLLLKCKAVLPTTNTQDTAIPVFSQSQPDDKNSQVTKHGQHTDKNGKNTDASHIDEETSQAKIHEENMDELGENTDGSPGESVKIAGIGTFSRAQIEAMLYLSNLKIQCEEGLAFCSWLEQNVVSAVPEPSQQALRDLTEQIKQSNPDAIISTQEVSVYTATLYRLKPPAWADAALITAFCRRLCEAHPTARLLGIQDAVTGKKTRTMDEKLKMSAQELVLDSEVLIIPVNFGNVHWCGILVEVKTNRVLFYDSMNQASYKSVLERVAWDLAKTLSDDYTVSSFNHPIQTDGHNCGFYIMLKFWRTVDKTLDQDVSQSGLTRLRFRILQFVLTGSVS